MKIINDIRLYKDHTSFGDKMLNAAIHRIVMKLREQHFSLGEFDHLYINFTRCQEENVIHLSDQVDRYHPWYRNCDVGITGELYDRLATPEARGEVIAWIERVLETLFASEDFDSAHIRACISHASTEGESMRMKFKEKSTRTRKAVIHLRYLDICKYLPLLQVFDMEDHLLFETDLPQTLTLDYLGEIQLSARKVTIKPRKNAFTSQMDPLVFEYQ